MADLSQFNAVVQTLKSTTEQLQTISNNIKGALLTDPTKLPLTGGSINGNVTATKFIGDLQGNADSATSVSGAEKWSLIIDSNAKLTQWATCTDGSKESVCIMPGTYTIDCNASGINMIDLESAGTKRVLALPGSIINLNNTSSVGSAIGYSTGIIEANAYKYYIKGLKLSVTGTKSNAFLNCVNLEGCNATISTTSTNDLSVYYGCREMRNCYGRLTSGASGYKSNVFSSCSKLSGSVAEVNAISDCASITGFRDCDNLVNSKATILVSGTTAAYGFVNCKYGTNTAITLTYMSGSTGAIAGLSNCTYFDVGYISCASNSGNGTIYGMSGCGRFSNFQIDLLLASTNSSASAAVYNSSYIENFYSSISSSSTIPSAGITLYSSTGYCFGCYAFASLSGYKINGFAGSNLINCYASILQSTSNAANIGTGYKNCTVLVGCYAGITSTGGTGIGFDTCLKTSLCRSTATTTAYSASYATSTANATYACADTSNGGFNS